ncbi:MAG: 2TM domain-containing protein [Cyanobacteria bacterium P01_G01_bin.39]
MLKTYSNEAVQQILQEAIILDQDNDISRSQLQEIAAEVGISATTLKEAETAWLERQKKSQRQAKRKREFIRLHLIPYIVVNIFLILLNLVTTPQYFWSVYPILGWGLGVAIDGFCLSQVENKKKTDLSNQ